jgi:hypothetical protein
MRALRMSVLVMQTLAMVGKRLNDAALCGISVTSPQPFVPTRSWKAAQDALNGAREANTGESQRPGTILELRGKGASLST